MAGVFTRNRFRGAPVRVYRAHLAGKADIRALVVNTGNANTGTGICADSPAHARRTCGSLAALMHVQPDQVLQFLTGVIMETLLVERIAVGLPAALAALTDAGWGDVALGIMTTDALPKAASRKVTIDGDTPTNGSFMLIATHQAGDEPNTLLASAAGRLLRDGEGAIKFIMVQVQGGRNQAECRLAAYAIGHSPLVKTAFLASAPDLGRILAAVDCAGIDDLDQSLIDLYQDDMHVVTQGGRHAGYQEPTANA